jgi:hypothetical protein
MPKAGGDNKLGFPRMAPELSRVLTLFRRFGKKSGGATIAVI